MTPTPDPKGAQPEQLVEEALRLATFIRERWNVENKVPPLGIADTLDALAAALSECRERREEAAALLRHYHATLRHVIDDSPETPESVKEYLRRSIRSHDLLAAQPPSEASERSGT